MKKPYIRLSSDVYSHENAYCDMTHLVYFYGFLGFMWEIW